MSPPSHHANIDGAVQCCGVALQAARAGDLAKAQRLLGKACSMAPTSSWDPDGSQVKRVAEAILEGQRRSGAEGPDGAAGGETAGSGAKEGAAGGGAGGGETGGRERGGAGKGTRWGGGAAWWAGGKAKARVLGKACAALVWAGWERCRVPVTRGANMVAGKRARLTAHAAARALSQTLMHLLAERTYLYGSVAVQPEPGNHSPAVQAAAQRCCTAVAYTVVGGVWCGGVALVGAAAYLGVRICLGLVWAMVGFVWWLGSAAGVGAWWLFCRFFWAPSWWASLLSAVCIWNADPPSCSLWPYPLAWWWWQGGAWNVVGTVVSLFLEVNLATFPLHAILAWTLLMGSLGWSAWWAKAIALVLSAAFWIISGAFISELAARAAGAGGQSPELAEEEVPAGAPEEVARMLRCSDHYSVMGLEPLCDVPADLKKAYHRKLLQVHPDKNGNAPGAAKAFQRLTDAYECLSVPRAKREYDRMLGAKVQADKGRGAGGGAEEEAAPAKGPAGGGGAGASVPPKGTAGKRRKPR